MKKTQKKSNVTYLSGYLGADAAWVETNKDKKRLLTFNIATNNANEEVKWTKIQFWDDKENPIENDLKKGDYVELKGYFKNEQGKEVALNPEFVLEELINHKIKDQTKLNGGPAHTLKGNLGQDPLLKLVEIDGVEKKVVLFSLAHNENESTKWINCQTWGTKIKSAGVEGLQKGDFVKVQGYFGKEYTTAGGEKKQDLYIDECVILKKRIQPAEV